MNTGNITSITLAILTVLSCRGSATKGHCAQISTPTLVLVLVLPSNQAGRPGAKAGKGHEEEAGGAVDVDKAGGGVEIGLNLESSLIRKVATNAVVPPSAPRAPPSACVLAFETLVAAAMVAAASTNTCAGHAYFCKAPQMSPTPRGRKVMM